MNPSTLSLFSGKNGNLKIGQKYKQCSVCVYVPSYMTLACVQLFNITCLLSTILLQPPEMYLILCIRVVIVCPSVPLFRLCRPLHLLVRYYIAEVTIKLCVYVTLECLCASYVTE